MKIIKLKIILLAVLFTVIIGVLTYSLLSSQLISSNSAQIKPDGLFGWKFPVAKFPLTGAGGNLAYSSLRDPGGIPQGLPVRLKIPAIGVDSAIEDALITSDGRMDVPVGSVNVAWFALGPHPGIVGSAVIGGHFGIKNGVPFVFYKLDKLKTGDKIYIVDDKGNTLTFVVRFVSLFSRNGDATEVFSSSDGLAHLNLITCEGVWNQTNGSYPERRVVFTDLTTSGNEILSQAQSFSSFGRSLGLGSSGADVSALQSLLERKGLLVIPAGVAKGFFGLLTSRALSEYQLSVDLPGVGVFGPLTRSKINLELSNNPVFPNAGEDQIAFQIAKNLYGNWLDLAITILLLISIIFATFLIIKRLI